MMLDEATQKAIEPIMAEVGKYVLAVVAATKTNTPLPRPTILQLTVARALAQAQYEGWCSSTQPANQHLDAIAELDAQLEVMTHE